MFSSRVSLFTTPNFGGELNFTVNAWLEWFAFYSMIERPIPTMFCFLSHLFMYTAFVQPTYFSLQKIQIICSTYPMYSSGFGNNVGINFGVRKLRSVYGIKPRIILSGVFEFGSLWFPIMTIYVLITVKCITPHPESRERQRELPHQNRTFYRDLLLGFDSFDSSGWLDSQNHTRQRCITSLPRNTSTFIAKKTRNSKETCLILPFSPHASSQNHISLWT